jgi:serine/threonine protein kinase
MLIKHLEKFPRADDIMDFNISGVRLCIGKEFLIGKGAQSNGVYVALGTDGSEKAVKLFFKATQDQSAEKEKMLMTLCETKDPAAHVVRFCSLDVYSHPTFQFLIMELCEETLEKFVNDNSLDDLIKDAPDIIRQILKGLAGLHRKPKRILHRDLKPSNILRNVHGKWLLADFGIGRILSDDKSTLEATQRGSKNWRAVESCDKTGTSDNTTVRYKTKSDIQVGFC